MKSATIPPLRVTPDLRQAAENVLHEGETLSNFVEASVRSQIDQRMKQQEFIARGMAAGEEARATNSYVSEAKLMNSLRRILRKTEKAQEATSRRR